MAHQLTNGFKKEYFNIFDSFIQPDQHKHHDDHHLGDVEDDGEEKGGQDVDGQVDGGGVPPLTISKSDQIGPNRENSKSPLFLQNRF